VWAEQSKADVKKMHVAWLVFPGRCSSRWVCCASTDELETLPCAFRTLPRFGENAPSLDGFSLSSHGVSELESIWVRLSVRSKIKRLPVAVVSPLASFRFRASHQVGPPFCFTDVVVAHPLLGVPLNCKKSFQGIFGMLGTDPGNKSFKLEAVQSQSPFRCHNCDLL
jgi:hypothetical protein